MTWLNGIFGAIGSALSLLGSYFTAKNQPDVKRAEVAQEQDKLDQNNTKAVQDAIKTGDISKLAE